MYPVNNLAPLLKKAFITTIQIIRRDRELSLSLSCRLLGISRQAVYQYIKPKDARDKVLSQIKPLVLSIRRDMPRISTRKLYYLLKSDSINYK